MGTKKLIFGVIMVAIFMTSAASFASVSMLGTRVVYSAGAKEQVLRFSNPDDHPNLIQVWVDRGNTAVGMDNGDAPFFVSPPVFRIGPNGGQVARLSYVGGALPEDRESLFYLNFVQVPAIKGSSLDDNQLILTVRSRMKIFYRPKALASEVDVSAALKTLSFSLERGSDGSRVVAHNKSGYYIVVQRAVVPMRGSDIEVARATLIPPFQDVSWSMPQAPVVSDKMILKLKIINDFGGDVDQEYLLQ